ncbi:IMPACT family protein [Bifidobacterium leontopitheci]|uniref:Thymidylate synthase n=1 Tax=Bifidobacterium leontopitheci TaxID=2650774 RepID=A0A6I1GJJ7_9BIFI|nr:YigZ family protein [Bifidobacterium leontopitheci]KAB7790892.1 thymidylate synthase [Bifidobacterium leontopitheci]
MRRTVLDAADSPAHDSLVEKKSEFIADACHADTLDEALAFVETIRERHPKSRHVAYAAMCVDGDGRVSERMSDDGEPSGTAGKPILDVLRQGDLIDCVVTVTRYFGGILLGSGGLIRAYSSAASLGVKAARLADIVACRRYAVDLQYPQLAVFQQIAASCDGRLENEQYTDRVALDVVLPQAREGEFLRRVRESFNAAVTPRPLEQVSRPVPVA